MQDLKYYCRSAMFLTAIIAFFLITPKSLQAQSEPESEEVADSSEEPSLASTRLGLITIQMPGDTLELQATLRAKIEGAWQKVGGETIKFLFVGDEEENPLGDGTTDGNGVTSIKLYAGKLPLNAEGYLTFSAQFEGNKELDSSDGEASIMKAVMKITPVKGDSMNTISVHVTNADADGTPIADATVSVYVKRLVGKLKVGEGTTDEEGNADIDFPTDLPGDDQGNLFITASIEELEGYGNIANSTVQTWGKPVSYKVTELPKALWSPHPPTWMIITFFVLMGTVWGHYVIILLKLSQVRKAA